MSKQPEQDIDEQESTTMEHFCAHLKEVREAKGIAIDSIAADLRLNIDLIKALENYDADHLPSKMFVMGYLRSYARHLGIDENELAQIDLSAVHQRVDVKSSLSGPSDKNSKHISVRLVTYMVTAGLLFLLVAWWLSMQKDISEIVNVEQYTQSESTADSGLVLPNVVESEAEVEKNIAEVEQLPEAETIKQNPVSPEEDDKAAVAEVIADEPETTEEQIAQSELKITFLEDSWTEISDASETRLLYGLYKKGREVIVNGEAPFVLFFGFAPGVIVTHNEEQIDHTKFHKNGVARFVVGTAEDNHLPDRN